MTGKVKKYLPILGLLALVVSVVIIRCGGNDFFLTGIPGIAQGVLVDENGDPILGATIWFLNSSDESARTVGTLAVVTDPESDLDCPDPTTAFDHACCTDSTGGYVCNCDGTNFITVNAQNTAGGALPDFDVLCGGPGQTNQLDVPTQPTPTATPSPSPSPEP